ncbi:MAG: Gfo/Idh/MocA family oxidoreductase [Armatimonadetes bacterium]|nr:Gfo/Idh/MocA family oxidoreductase [Armatimonadota bacterium]
MAKKIRAAVIGVGIGKYHIEGYQSHPLAEVVAVCDVREDALHDTASKYRIPNAFTDYRKMLKTPGIDAVSVCVPNKLHMPITVDCLKAGLHVLCEKPLARTAAEGQKMVEAAKAAKRLLMVQFNNRFRPESQLLKQYVDEGLLGDIYFARCGWIRRNGIPGWGSWFTNKEMAGGGPLIDLAVHMLDLTMWLMGNPEPVVVLASAYQKFGHKMECLGPWGTPNPKGVYDVEDMAVAMIKFANGATIALEASWASRCKREWVYSTLMGDKAGASLERVFEVDGVDDTAVDTLEVYLQRFGQPVNEQLIFPADPAMGRLTAVRHFVDCILTGKQPICPGTDGLRIMKILDAAYKSAKTGNAVRIA